MNEWDCKSTKLESWKYLTRNVLNFSPFKNVEKHFTFFLFAVGQSGMRVWRNENEKTFPPEWNMIPFYESAKNSKQKQQTSRVENFSREEFSKITFPIQQQKKNSKFLEALEEKIATKTYFENFHFRWLWESFLTPARVRANAPVCRDPKRVRRKCSFSQSIIFLIFMSMYGDVTLSFVRF